MATHPIAVVAAPASSRGEATAASVRDRIAAIPPSSALIAAAIAAMPLAQTDLVGYPAWTPKAAIALLLLPAGAVALTRLALRGDRAALAAMVALGAASWSTLASDKPVLSLVGPPNVGNGLLFLAAFLGTWALVRGATDVTRRTVRTALVGAGAVSATAAWSSIVVGWPGRYRGVRAMAFTGNPVHLGAVCAATAMVLAAGMTERRAAGTPVGRWRQIVEFLAVAAVASGGQPSGTRSVVLAVLPGLAWLLWRNGRAAWRASTAVVVGLVVGDAMMRVFAGLSIAARVGANGLTDSWRSTLWPAALSAIGRRPVLGYGPGRTNVSVTRYLPSTFCNPYRVNDVHNVVLQVLVTTGVLGALTIGWWAWAGARRAKGPAAYAAVALLVVAMLEPFALVTALPTAAFVALACPAVTLDRRRRSSLVVGVLMVPAVLASAVLVIGMDAFNTANVGADPVAYRTASRLLPPWPEVAVSGVLANVLDSHDAAFAAARDAIRRAPGDSIGWTRLAALEARFGSVERAKEDFGQALRLDPADKEAKESLWTLNGEPDACPGAKQPALLPASGG